MICDELIQDQLKIEMPSMAIGFKQQTFNPGLAYEIKLANSPFSIQANAALFYRKDAMSGAGLKFLSTGAGLEFRYYYLQKFMMRVGKAGGNLSGLYAGVKGSYDITTVKRRDGLLRYPIVTKARDFNTALSLGYQQRLFRRIYIDGSVFYNKTSPTAEKFTVFPFPLSYRTFGISRNFISSKMSIGFTF
ncbi:hypothetical protein GCM10011325_25960 [Dyadobacter sediminis]|nr:hypothetical protein GCM10011325_25960 [Dyadobacter sediminis]